MAYKLLLADDSVTIQRVIELTFADEDFQVVAVGDGRQAIERIAADRPDIVLADVGMPERDGFEVAAYVKQNPDLCHIPVLLLTGAFEPVDETRVRAVGCDGVLAKPFEPQMLIARVKELLSAPRGQKAEAPDLSVDSPDDEPTLIVPSNDVADPGLEAFNITPVAASDPRTAVDDYFDRLDAAFASMTTAPPLADEPLNPSSPSESALTPGGPPGSAWSVPTASAARPEPFEEPLEVAPVPSWRTASEPTPAWAAAPDTAIIGATPEVSAAFDRLLEEEQGGRVPTTVRLAPAPAAIPIDAIADEVTRRVVERLADRSVHDQVAEIVSKVAERLVREEIERLKAGLK